MQFYLSVLLCLLFSGSSVENTLLWSATGDFFLDEIGLLKKLS